MGYRDTFCYTMGNETYNIAGENTTLFTTRHINFTLIEIQQFQGKEFDYLSQLAEQGHEMACCNIQDLF